MLSTIHDTTREAQSHNLEVNIRIHTHETFNLHQYEKVKILDNDITNKIKIFKMSIPLKRIITLSKK